MVQQAPAPTPATQSAISQDDRALAACCHGSIFVGFPVIAPLVIYAIKKDQSRFVAFHALQAALAHLAVIPLMIAGYLVGVAFTLGVSLALGDGALLLPLGLLGAWGVGFCLPWLLVAAVSILAGVRALSGEAYRIPIVAGLVDRILAPVTPAARG